ncbi:MAG: aminoglycoside phosphotransferase family protein [Actinomycetota bacterium]
MTSTATTSTTSTVAFHPAPYLDGGLELLTGILEPLGTRPTAARVRQIKVRPARSVTTHYDVTTEGGGSHRIVVRAARRTLPGLGPVAHDAAGHPICAFADLADPALPGLAAATNPTLVARLFADLGIGAATDRIALRVRAHRPLRRAVIEATGPAGRLFLKVVPPTSAELLHRRHRLLTGAGLPVAPSVGWSDRGIVVIGAISGSTLREELRNGTDGPPIADVHSLLDSFPNDVADLDGPSAPIDRIDEHGALLTLVQPALRNRLERLNDHLRRIDADAGTDRLRPEPVHGDLHEAQLMTEAGRLRGLLDVDGIGAGRRIDDDANALGHLSVLDLVVGHPHARRLGKRWLSELDLAGRHDPAALRARIAAVVMGLATGPFRVQEANWERNTVARLDLAAAWLAAAERAARRRSRQLVGAR